MTDEGWEYGILIAKSDEVKFRRAAGKRQTGWGDTVRKSGDCRGIWSGKEKRPKR